MDNLFEPGQPVFKLCFHLRVPYRRTIADSARLHRNDNLQQLTLQLLVPLPTLFELLQQLCLHGVLQVAEARPEVLQLSVALLHSLLLLGQPLLHSRQAHERLRIARLRCRVVLHGLRPLVVVDVDCGVELPVVGLLQHLRIVTERIGVSDKALMQTHMGRASTDPLSACLLQDWIQVLHSFCQFHAHSLWVWLQSLKALHRHWAHALHALHALHA
mmetsp:Transcript_108975/g.216430  ORF Transcript_108975/g.216430 Transcript_108975/m.216430 type:complete len:216 (+) Transcript_108975:342-989(+)